MTLYDAITPISELMHRNQRPTLKPFLVIRLDGHIFHGSLEDAIGEYDSTGPCASLSECIEKIGKFAQLILEEQDSADSDTPNHQSPIPSP